MRKMLADDFVFEATERPDGSVYVRSAQVPFFHAVAPHRVGWQEFVDFSLRRHLSLNAHNQGTDSAGH
jgi:hypothetical protein